MAHVKVANDVTVASIEEMEPVHGGMMRRARATLGVTAWGMQVFDLPAGFEHYPEHAHGEGEPEAGQEEVYVPLAGSAALVAGDETFELRPGVWARVGPGQPRRLVPGSGGFRYLAIGGIPGSFAPGEWSELGGPVPGE
jgi:mannose-6-phosphate isomerase-like protein (cupin superfamily)